MPNPLIPRPKSINTPLFEYFDRTKKTEYWLAKTMRVAIKSVHNWNYGISLPSLVHAFKLQQITDGEIPASAWLGTDLAKAQWKGDAVNIERHNLQAKLSHERRKRRLLLDKLIHNGSAEAELGAK